MAEIFQKVDDFRWKISKGFKEGMRTDALVFADEEMLKHIIEDKAYEQLVNVACLPGIVGQALAMPDIHFGYGFPIGGVAAFDPENGGVISPGGVGYDINCLSFESLVLHEFGYTMKIGDLEKKWQKQRVKCIRLNPGKPTDTDIVRYIKFKPKGEVYKIETITGKAIIATEDHPFYTPQGMLPLYKVKDKIAIYPFEGVPYKEPPDQILLD
jgi:tRNA-splicing ligase RtcB